MPERVEGESGDWRLGVEAEARAEPRSAEHELAPDRARDLSAVRLDRPLYVLTAEHLGWFLVLLWTLTTRLMDLGGRPMAASEAARALAALRALRAHPPLNAGWVTALESMVFSFTGAGDSLARIVTALFGILLVATALLLRRELGRAGALALGALLALSPTVTWCSRSNSPLVPALALTMLAIGMVCAAARRPTGAATVTLAAAVAFAVSAAPAGMFAGVALAAILALLGIWQALAVDDAGVRLRVWWERRRGLFLGGVLVSFALFYALESGLFERSFIAAVAAEARRNWISPRSGVPGFHPGIAFYLPEFVFYEFLVVALAAFGILAMLALRLRSKLSIAAFLWMAASAAFFLWTPVRRPELTLAMLVPAAVLGASALDWLHHTGAWRVIRYPILALALLTLYAQVLTNFVWTAPDPTEAPWARHALLYWTEPATTLTTTEECEHALKAVGPNASVFFDLKSPVLQWYLRTLKPAADMESAAVVVSAAARPKPAGMGESSRFTFEERWNPAMAGLDTTRALRYFLTAQTWAPLQSNDVRLSIRQAAAPRTPTVIFAPHAQPSPTVTPPPASPIASPSPVSTPTASAASPTAAPSPTASAREQATPSPEASPAPSARRPAPSAMLASPRPAASPSPAPDHPDTSAGNV